MGLPNHEGSAGAGRKQIVELHDGGSGLVRIARRDALERAERNGGLWIDESLQQLREADWHGSDFHACGVEHRDGEVVRLA